MIPFLVLVLVAAAVAAYIAFPRGDERLVDDGVEELRAEHRSLLRQLRELDEDLAAGRIAAEDRAAGRRALGPPLRAVTEALRERGESTAAPPSAAPSSAASPAEPGSAAQPQPQARANQR